MTYHVAIHSETREVLAVSECGNCFHSDDGGFDVVEASRPPPIGATHNQDGSFTAPPMPEPRPRPILLPVAALWSRMSDDEAEAVEKSVKSWPVRLRRVFNAATTLDATSDDFAAIRDRLASVLGEDRAAAVLLVG